MCEIVESSPGEAYSAEFLLRCTYSSANFETGNAALTHLAYCPGVERASFIYLLCTARVCMVCVASWCARVRG